MAKSKVDGTIQAVEITAEISEAMRKLKEQEGPTIRFQVNKALEAYLKERGYL